MALGRIWQWLVDSGEPFAGYWPAAGGDCAALEFAAFVVAVVVVG